MNTPVDSRPIWYLAGPFYRYVEDVKALAKKAGLVIIDANATADRRDAADPASLPTVTLRPAVALAESGFVPSTADVLRGAEELETRRRELDERERQVGDRALELDARDRAIGERETALAEREKAGATPGANVSGQEAPSNANGPSAEQIAAAAAQAAGLAPGTVASKPGAGKKQ